MSSSQLNKLIVGTLSAGILLYSLFLMMSSSMPSFAAFTGPGSLASGTGSGSIGISGGSLSIGTSSPIGDTKFFVLASSTGSAGFSVKIIQPGSLVENANDGKVPGIPLFVIRNDGRIGISSFIGNTNTSTVVIGGNVRVDGTLAATNISAALSGSMTAGNVLGRASSSATSSIFGANTGGGNYSFPAGLSVGLAEYPTGNDSVLLEGSLGFSTGPKIIVTSSTLKLQAGGNTSSTNGSIFFQDSAGTPRARFNTVISAQSTTTYFLPDAGNTLNNNLAAYWRLDEAIASRFESVGAANLTLADNGGVDAGPGVKGLSAAFVPANSEYLSIADNATLSMGDIDFTIATWVYMNSTTTAMLVDKWNYGANQREYALFHTNQLNFWVSGDGSANGDGTAWRALSGPSLTTGQWHFIVAWHDSAANKIYVQANNGAIASTTWAGGVYDGSSPFYLGRNTDSFLNGRMDETGIWKRVLTAQERTDLYNSGSGNTRIPIGGTAATYFSPDAGNDLRQSLNAYWKFDEVSGTRYDTWGFLTLTDNNTVTANPGKQGNAAQFTSANSEYFSIVDSSYISTGDIDFSIAGWVYMDSKPATASIFSKYQAAGTREYWIGYESSADRIGFYLYNAAGSSIGFVRANNFGAPSTGNWYFLYVEHDSVANTMSISINNGTLNSANTSGAPADTTSALYIGNDNFGSYWNGRIDEFGYWKRKLTAQERTDLYNTGLGNTYLKNAPTVVATGGTITRSGDYTIHTFNSSGTFTVTSPGQVEYLIVGGGGGGGTDGGRGGGGGAGGVRYGTTTVAASTYPITVGIGGLGATASNNSLNGATSSFNGISALGGGRGGGRAAGGYSDAGGNGGSGGGGDAYYMGVGGSGTAGQGFGGGTGANGYGAGGGGGAGGAGSNGSGNDGGAGGRGTTISITGTPAGYGGGGGGGYTGTIGLGGYGGGGNGGNAVVGTNGTPNTGGGGGGQYGNGATGVVIIRYLTPGSSIYGTLHMGSTNTSQADLAENYNTTDRTLGPGDVVVLDKEKSNESVAFVKKSSSPREDAVGIVSTNPGILMNEKDTPQAQRQVPLALEGRVPTKVSAENGPIRVGDRLTASSLPGVAMRATEPGTVVGIALESYAPVNSAAVGKIDVLVKAGYWEPPMGLITKTVKGFWKTYAGLKSAVQDSASDMLSRSVTISPSASNHAKSELQNGEGAEDSKLNSEGSRYVTYGLEGTRPEIRVTGESVLKDGYARVMIDASAAELMKAGTVKVFLSPRAGISGELRAEEKSAQGFTVKESNGAGAGTFDWLLVAEKK